ESKGAWHDLSESGVFALRQAQDERSAEARQPVKLIETMYQETDDQNSYQVRLTQRSISRPFCLASTLAIA
ncbi:hypothetical protein, partial [Endozoicomonas acroporae]|uniref:hypothetical protein n=1 Tax=Endozoicomonas acroporae TaxID=1701104 RepID=UPI0019D4F2A2